uniref:Uncharacterized protein n=1 Tax=Arundo donax TaxID=35708 RepID=A0A0A9CHL2_ARUDO
MALARRRRRGPLALRLRHRRRRGLWLPRAQDRRLLPHQGGPLRPAHRLQPVPCGRPHLVCGVPSQREHVGGHRLHISVSCS